MPDLVLGPLLRFVDDRRATVWVETDASCTVEVLGFGAATFAVAGRHYAIVVVDGLEPATHHPYEVRLDGELRWPLPGDTVPSLIRTSDVSRPVRLAFGSCRVAAPDREPYTSSRQEHPEGQGIDALAALAARVQESPAALWPDLLVFVGDQVYADLDPDGSALRFDQYCRLYHESWNEPAIRWLLSTVPSVMVFDDHDVIDDWNISQAWLDEVTAERWWGDHVVAAIASFWLYQHLGNLAPEELDRDPVLAALRRAEPAGGHERGLPTALADLADRARLERGEGPSPRWSFARQVVGTAAVRLVMLDVRNGRRLVEGDRAIIDGAGWQWLAGEASQPCDHLLVGSSLPWLLPLGVHDIERWSDVLGGGRWGRLGRRLAERARRRGDLEHWPAFGRSFERLAALIREVSDGEGRADGDGAPALPPASAIVLSGDVHFSYVASLDATSGSATRVVQLTSSPLRNGVPSKLQDVLRLATSRAGSLVGRAVLRTVADGRGDETWTMTAGPWFGNGIASLTFDGRESTVRFEQPRHDVAGDVDLVTVHQERLTRHDRR